MPVNRYLNNNLVNKYIQQVYEKYEIEDPVQRQLNSLRKGEKGNISNLITPDRNDINWGHKTERPMSTKNKLDKLRQSFKKDSFDVISTTRLSNR